MNNDIEELRGHLFDTLRGLKDGTVDVEKAKAMSNLAGTIIETAKVEVDYMRVTGESGTSFIKAEKPEALPGATVRVHRLK